MENNIINKKMFAFAFISSILSALPILSMIYAWNDFKWYCFLCIVLATFPTLIVLHFYSSEKKHPMNFTETQKKLIQKLLTIIIFCFAIYPILTALLIRNYINFEQATNLIFASFGMIFLLVGKNLPALPINHFIGLRNKYTLNNPEVWQKTNQFCFKLTLSIGGLFILISTLLATGKLNYHSLPITLITPTIIALYTIILQYYSRYIHKKITSN